MGMSTDHPTGEGLPRTWEVLALIHLALLLIGTSWWFGGQSPGARQALHIWGTVGMVLFAVGWFAVWRADTGSWKKPLRHLWPLLVYDLLVGLSCLNPSTRETIHQGELLLAHIEPRWSWLPSSARPALSALELWQFNGIVLSCYNVCLLVRRRSSIRLLLALVAANAMALAVFGTFQKLLGAKEIFFGAVPTPQPYFFASFVYHNHWGAFVLLALGVCFGLLFHHLHRSEHRDFLHSPAFLGGVAVLFLTATAPLSGSRSTTLLGGLFVLAAAVNFVRSVAQRRRKRRASLAPLVGGAVAVLALALAAVAYLSRDVIQTRARITAEQFSRVGTAETNYAGFRLRLYRDTWAMAQAKPLFGWGLETYGHVFMIYNSAPDLGPGSVKPYFEEAHNDWFQSLAEVGFAGTGALVLLGAIPWWRRSSRPRVRGSIPRHLLAGCGLLLAYAAVEFPLANPAVTILFWLCLYSAFRYAELDTAGSRPENESTHA